jgi:hypothetical protein
MYVPRALKCPQDAFKIKSYIVPSPPRPIAYLIRPYERKVEQIDWRGWRDYKARRQSRRTPLTGFN